MAVVAAIISYQHAYELVRSHGESGVTARLLPFTVDGLIWAASMVVLDASRRNSGTTAGCVELGPGIVATVGANLAHGVGHGLVGALVSAWPALALIGSFELLMTLIRTGRSVRTGEAEGKPLRIEGGQQWRRQFLRAPACSVNVPFLPNRGRGGGGFRRGWCGRVGLRGRAGSRRP